MLKVNVLYPIRINYQLDTAVTTDILLQLTLTYGITCNNNNNTVILSYLFKGVNIYNTYLFIVSYLT